MPGFPSSSLWPEVGATDARLTLLGGGYFEAVVVRSPGEGIRVGFGLS